MHKVCQQLMDRVHLILKWEFQHRKYACLNFVPLLVELDHSYHLWRNKQTVSHNNSKMLICKQNKITFGMGGEVLGVDDFDLGLFGASLSESSAALNRLFGAWGTFFRELFIASSLS